MKLIGKITLVNTVTPIAVGGLDEGAAYMDEQAGRAEPFKTWSDWFRIGAVVVGGLGAATEKFSDIAVPLYISSLPLLTKSVVAVIRAKKTATAPAPKARVTVTRRVSAYVKPEESYQMI